MSSAHGRLLTAARSRPPEHEDHVDGMKLGLLDRHKVVLDVEAASGAGRCPEKNRALQVLRRSVATSASAYLLEVFEHLRS